MINRDIADRARTVLASFEGLSLHEGLSVLLTAISSITVRQGIPLETVLKNIREAYANVEKTMAKEESERCKQRKN